MQLWLTTHPGLEDVAFEELEATFADVTVTRDGARLAGRVLARVPLEGPEVAAKVGSMRTIHHALEGLGQVELPDPPTLAAVKAATATVDVPGLEGAASFRVTSKRVGAHPFSSLEVAQRAGAALFERYRTPVDLDAPAEVVRVDLVERTLLVARALTHHALSERPGLPFHQRVGLKANVAAAAVWLTHLEHPTRIADPFCGGGTLLLEAGARHPEAELWASDWIEKATQGALHNLTTAGLGERARARTLDARTIDEVYPVGTFDAVITNPPFGVRIGRRTNFYRFYLQILPKLRALLKPGGRLTLLTDRKKTFDQALEKVGGFERRRELRVQLGGVDPWIVCLLRTGP